MPRYRPTDSGEHPWVAIVQLAGQRYYLGSFAWKGEAIQREEQFKQELRRIRIEADAMWSQKVESHLVWARVVDGAR